MFGSLSLTVVVSWLLLLSSCFALKLHFNEHPQTSEQVLYLDNLNATGANWYYGTTNASAYEIKIYGQGLLGKPKPCQKSTPFTNETGNRYSCFGCDEITENTDFATAKVLFNLGSRICQICQQNTTTLCDKYLVKMAKHPYVAPVSTAARSEPCPSATPFYDTESKQCITCVFGTQFYALNQTCIPILFLINPQTPNIILPNNSYLVLTNKKSREANPERNLQYCPDSTPYLKNNTCLACPTNQLFDVSASVCVQHCGDNLFYDTIIKQCVKAIYVVNPDSPNLLVLKPDKFSDWKNSVNQRKDSSQAVLYCTFQTPYLIGGFCGICLTTTPLYEVHSQTCTNCPEDLQYIPLTHTCASTAETNSNISIQRMVANIL